VEPGEYEVMYRVEDVHWWYRALHELVLHFVSEENRKKGQLHIFDAGCGTGRLCQLMSAYGDVTGCDISDLALEFCRKRKVPSVFRADLNDIELGPGRYDIITSVDVLYHKAVRDDSFVLRKLYHALKPGGVIILNLVAYNFLKSFHDIAVHTERRYKRKDVIQQLTDAGFTVEKASYRVGFLFLPITCYRLIQKTFLKYPEAREARSDLHVPPRFLNKMLLRCNLIENIFIKNFGIPFGTSIFAVARKV